MLSFGIMQGRLTPANGRGIQFFPFENWENEFMDCARIGLDEIEWIFDYERYEENPLWTEEGCAKLNEVIQRTGVSVRSVCFDYFMRRPFFKYREDKQLVLDENRKVFKTVVDHMKLLGADLIEIPLVDDSAIKNERESIMAVELIREFADYAGDKSIRVGLETDLPPGKFRSFIEAVSRTNVCANYDSGNSSGVGYDPIEEILSLSSLIANVHMKDRKFHGTTVALGHGDADFDKVFSALKTVGYCRSLILQAARSSDGSEEDNIREQIAFIKKYCERYHVGEL